ncbi:MAG: aminotransferase class V-fold PLP-dependent enzyme [Alphaproteobacteria bacterium]|nr:aminotransferase class V-fold PLP-dependent enzyme [Alphaproteobacteria bacterium]
MLDLKRHFSHSIGRPGAPLHFAAHSHHPWPDVTFEAQKLAWLDAATLLDRKWDKIFGEVIPEAQRHVASRLSLPDPSSIVFGPNTHSFLLRILSCTPAISGINVLSTDSEFHSFTRQMDRLVEADVVNLVRVPVEPFATFNSRFMAELKKREDWDLVWFSQVFFNSGRVVGEGDLIDIVEAIPSAETLAVIDGYHAFMAIPVDLSAIGGRAFFVAGGYKYAMAGEGACFLHCPPGYGLRPRDTGWYAEFGALDAARADEVAFGVDASRFAGATFDPSGIYRLNAVMRWMDDNELTVGGMDAHCLALQKRFVERLDVGEAGLRSTDLVIRDLEACGRFLTFETEQAARIDGELAQNDIIVDHRGNRLRIGFGVYQDMSDVERLVRVLKAVA